MPSGYRWSQAWAWLAALPVLLILGPVLPGLYWALAPSLDLSVWRALWSDTQWPQALRTTLVSAGLGSVLGMALAAGLATALYPGPRWLAMQRRLPLMLSVPHAAFAVGLLFLISPSGWLARAVAPLAGWIDPPAWTTVQDPLGLSLALALGLKESWFLLWVCGTSCSGRRRRQLAGGAEARLHKSELCWLCIGACYNCCATYEFLPWTAPELGAQEKPASWHCRLLPWLL